MKEGQLMSFHGNQGAAAKLAKNSVQGLKELENMLAESPSPERVSSKLAQILNVARNEVAVLRVEKGSLRFVFPPELRAAGMIPMSSSAVAARTVSTGTSLLSNSFARVKHASLFETVKLGAPEDNQRSEQLPIQKIMSVPVSLPEPWPPCIHRTGEREYAPQAQVACRPEGARPNDLRVHARIGTRKRERPGSRPCHSLASHASKMFLKGQR